MKASDEDKSIEVVVNMECKYLTKDEMEEAVNKIVDDAFQYVFLPRYYARHIEVK
jgi:hypothetical protein